MKKFHDALKAIYGLKNSGATALLSADGSTLLTDKGAILKRWAEHFNSIDASLIHLYKQIANPQVFDNHRGISPPPPPPPTHCWEDTGKNSVEPPKWSS